ncbi:hypothetical protein EVAR_74979_1 [Eumeta japonica]|uniref:Uncharacterized protein n=1 Tax=Eumeta variegata TaxID=151549 RepID=A0A4C1VCI8_EUMVA|nr:hypothetical protein EVAR_74979_1 [Eumeta japonica]
MDSFKKMPELRHLYSTHGIVFQIATVRWSPLAMDTSNSRSHVYVAGLLGRNMIFNDRDRADGGGNGEWATETLRH